MYYYPASHTPSFNFMALGMYFGAGEPTPRKSLMYVQHTHLLIHNVWNSDNETYCTCIVRIQYVYMYSTYTCIYMSQTSSANVNSSQN